MVSTEKSRGTTGEVRFNARLPANLHKHLTERAAANGRSMNSELIEIVRFAVENEGDRIIRKLMERRADLAESIRTAESNLKRMKSKLEESTEYIERLMDAERNPDGSFDPEAVLASIVEEHEAKWREIDEGTPD